MTALRCFLLAPEIVFAARVNMASATYPLDTLIYDGVTTGSINDVELGMTLLLGSAAGLDDYGRQRVRQLGDGTHLYVGRSSQGINDGELNAADNAYITVLNLYQVWARIPYIDEDGVIYKDSTLVAAGNIADPPPKANGGPGFAGTIDSGSGVITVEFDASASFQFDAAVSSALSPITAYLWDVGDGTITVGTITSESITVTFPAGFRYVTLGVTSDAGKPQAMRIPIYARDPDDDDTVAHQVVSHRMTAAGQEIDIRILDDIPRSTYPDGTLVMLWDDDLQVSAASRAHMLFIGWEHTAAGSTRIERTGTLRDATLHCVDVAGRLKSLPGFAQIVEYAASPSAWTQTRYPNVFYYLYYLLYWHSTAPAVADLLLGTQILNNFSFKILSSDEDNLYNQVNRMANNVTPDHYFTCNRYGQMMLVVDPLVQHVDDRTSSIAHDLTDGDWYDLQVSYERAPRVYKLLAYAVENSTSTVTPLAALAPGLAEGQGANTIETSERITDNQFDLNNVTGNRYARLNAPYGRVVLTLPYAKMSNGDDPARMGWVRLNIDSINLPQRELPFDWVKRGIVHEINITYEYQRTGLARTATLIWEAETSGPAALTFTPPGA